MDCSTSFKHILLLQISLKKSVLWFCVVLLRVAHEGQSEEPFIYWTVWGAFYKIFLIVLI